MRISVTTSSPIGILRHGLTLPAITALLLSSRSASAFIPSIGGASSLSSSKKVSFLQHQNHRHSHGDRDNDDKAVLAFESSSIIADDAEVFASSSSSKVGWTNSIVRKGKIAAATACTMGALLFSPQPTIQFNLDSPSSTSTNRRY